MYYMWFYEARQNVPYIHHMASWLKLVSELLGSTERSACMHTQSIIKVVVTLYQGQGAGEREGRLKNIFIHGIRLPGSILYMS